MLTVDLFESDFNTNDLTLIDALRDFLPLAVKTLELPHIPKISLEKSIEKSNVPTFGRFTNDDDHVYVHVANRNPNDILRTLAHEMVHYKQRTEHELGSGSWHTGSPAENQAHELAGVIMRNFNSKYPQYLRMKPVILPGGDSTKELDEEWSEKYKRSINCNNPKGFSQKAHCAGRKKANENFADGKNPGRKGLAKRSGVDCKQSVTKLRDVASHSSGEKQRMAHWCANMKAGKK